MALSSYAELQTSVANSLGRASGSMPQGNVTDYIAEGEAYLNRELRLLQMETSATLTLSAASDSVAFPAGFLELLELRYTDNAYPLSQKSTVDIGKYSQTTQGRPAYFKIGAAFEFERPAAADYTLKLTYLKGWDIATDDTNWLLENAPETYRQATLRFGYADIRNEGEEKKSIQRVERSIFELNKRTGRSKRKSEMSVESALTPRNRGVGHGLNL
jgi:hypothetical protein